MDVRLQFEGIRCFSTKQDAIIHPLTILVGENSSGKTTFLALCQIASSVVDGFNGRISFNDPPFLLGAYDQIASYRGGRAGHVKSFSISMTVGEGVVEATFASELGQPMLQSWRLCADEISFEVRRRNGADRATVLAQSARGEVETQYPVAWALDLLRLPDWIPRDAGEALPKLMSAFSDADLAKLRWTWDAVRKAFSRTPYAFAPMRTSPQRTYDPVSAEPRPEGSHVPMLLAQLFRSTARKEWAELRSGLKEFGEESGLFDDIEVIGKGKQESDPFQIGVKSGGTTFNLIDVGYGVSQVLPIIVDTLRRSRETSVFLMQQPEVHLHPRAQAELGSFFARLANQERRFIVETHSDHLVDRVRMEVRSGKLTPQDVSLLYFERRQLGATIHNLELDERGGIVNPPPTYRRFFLEEERSLLGI